jgi:hypothetical protein
MLRFGEAGAANDFRGALGFQLPESVFRPRNESGPSGLRDSPRPFVLRVREIEGRVLRAGEVFEARLHLFDAGAEEALIRAVRGICSSGLGPDRVPLQFVEVRVEQLMLDLSPRCAAPERIEVDFLTPAELKGWDGNPPLPFQVLVARLRDRVSALRGEYGPGPAAFDFAGLAERAKAVQCDSCRLGHASAARKSLRTGRRHPLGGFTGACVYSGDLREFLPLLEAGVYTGVGRQTVWGKGEISLRAVGSAAGAP